MSKTTEFPKRVTQKKIRGLIHPTPVRIERHGRRWHITMMLARGPILNSSRQGRVDYTGKGRHLKTALRSLVDQVTFAAKPHMHKLPEGGAATERFWGVNVK